MCPLGVVVMSIERGFKGTSLRMYHRIHVSYIYLHVHYIYHKIQPNARKYITHMDPIGYAFHTGIFSESTRSLRFLMVMVVFYIPSHPKTKRMLRTLKRTSAYQEREKHLQPTSIPPMFGESRDVMRAPSFLAQKNC